MKLYEFMTYGHNPSPSSVMNCVMERDLYTQGTFQKRKKSGHLCTKDKETLNQLLNQINKK